jgi:peptidoglycan-associated lipoprotein
MKIIHIVSLSILALMVAVIDCGTQQQPPPPPFEPPSAATEPDTAARILPYVPPETTTILPLTLASIYFESNSAEITPVASAILDGNGLALLNHPSAAIRIEGNCDDRGSEQYNLILGKKRAEAARNYLANFGIDSSRLTTISYGESRPIALGHTKEARAKNRRDDFVVLSE